MSKPSTSQKITIGILIILVCINAVWATAVEYNGPLIAILFYALLVFLCWRRNHFQAGIIGGVFGLGIHIYELISKGIGELKGIDLGFLGANIFLPVLLIYFSYRAHQETTSKEVGE